MAETVIDVQQLTKRFGDFTAVNHVSFQVERGEVLGYLGPNGSGKTTTIRMLLGLLQPTEGDALVLGKSIRTQAEAIRPQVGYMSQKFALYDELTMRENLDFYAGVYGVPGKERAGRVRDVIAMLDLGGRENDQVGDLSGGLAAAAGVGLRAGASSQIVVSRRTNQRRRSGGAARVLGFDLRAGFTGRDDFRDDALHGRSRTLPSRGHHVSREFVGAGYAERLEGQRFAGRGVGCESRSRRRGVDRGVDGAARCARRGARGPGQRSAARDHRARRPTPRNRC